MIPSAEMRDGSRWMTKDHGLPVAVTTADNVKALNSTVSLFSISRWPRSDTGRSYVASVPREADVALKQR
jgi:hypothetical protein